MASSCDRPQKRRTLRRVPTVDADRATSLIKQQATRQVAAEWFHDGTLLERLALQHMSAFKELTDTTAFGRLKGRRTWGSLCSGSEGAHFVVEACERALNTTASGQGNATVSDQVRFEQIFACENDDRKRRWIEVVINSKRRSLGKEEISIFKDIKEMGQASAACWTHGKPCPVPDCEFLFVSTSCKDLSTLSHAKFSQPVLSLQTSPGGTADTFRLGLLSYLDHHKVHVIVYENSDHLADPAHGDGTASSQVSNYDVYLSEMTSKGFEGQCFICNAKNFGLPQNRRRFCAVHVSVTYSIVDYASRAVTDMLATLSAFLQVCQRAFPAAESLLLSNEDEKVREELARRLARGQYQD